MRALLAAAAAFALCACDDGVAFPPDYAETYTEVRDCRPNGGSHNFNQIRVVADPSATAAYLDREVPFPVGSIVLKEEYDGSDVDCAGEVVRWTVMQRLDEGNEAQLSWSWQEVDADRRLTSLDEPRCFGCHAACVPPEGYANTCTVP